MPDEKEIQKSFYGYYRSVARHGWLEAARLAANSAWSPARPFSQAELLGWCLVARLFDPNQKAEALWYTAALFLKDIQEGREKI